ncbi:MAG TPA: threonine/serine dehydratase [Nocardioidaceae bacterium]
MTAAADRIAGAVRRTPLIRADWGRSDAPLWLKAESLQVGGAFKARGATNAIALLSPEEKASGVITHSSGNHAQAVARAARDAGVSATIVMPHQSPAVKRAATEALGATVVLVDIAERAAEVERIRARTGAVFVPPFDDRRIIAGQGTVGLEIATDLPDVETVFVPVSGGGLISGIAVAIKACCPEARLVGVEPELAGDLADGFARGEHVVWDTDRTGRTIADGLRVTGVGELNWLHITALVDDVVTVTEQQILGALRRIVLDSKLVAEPSGAVAAAGYLAHPDLCRAGPAVAIVSGGNVEPAVLCDVVSRSGGGSSS